MFVKHEVGQLMQHDLKAAAARVLRVLEETRGNSVHAAARIGISHSTFNRWIAKLEKDGLKLRSKLQRIRTNAPVTAKPVSRRAKMRVQSIRIQRSVCMAIAQLDERTLRRLLTDADLPYGDATAVKAWAAVAAASSKVVDPARVRALAGALLF